MKPNHEGVYFPRDEAEVAALIRRARAEGRELRVRGARHSEPRVIHTTAWLAGDRGAAIEVSLDRLDWFELDEAAGEVHVGGGLRLGHDPRDPLRPRDRGDSLCPRLDRLGYALPNLGGVIHQSVAGFLATGSEGGSLKYSLPGAVTRIRVIDGTGLLHVVGRDDPRFGGIGACLGLMGVVTGVSLRVEPRFAIEGSEATYADDDPALALFEPGGLAELLGRGDYVRLLWWPQPRVGRVVVFRARRASAIDPRRSPHHVLPPTLGSPRLSQGLASLALSGLDRRPAIEPLRARVQGFLTRQFVPVGPVQRFRDAWWRALPMDTRVDERILPTRFLEAWVPLDRATEAIVALRRYFERGGIEATRNYACEIYPGPPSPFWMSPGFERPSVRFNFMWHGYNRGEAESRLFAGALAVLEAFAPRLHWGKSLVTPVGHARRVPRWDDVVALRRAMDPDGVFLTAPLAAALGLTAERLAKGACAKGHVSRDMGETGRAGRAKLHWPAGPALRPGRPELVHEAEARIEVTATLPASAERCFAMFGEFREMESWVPLFVDCEGLNGAVDGTGAIVDERFGLLTVRLRAIAVEPPRRWLAACERMTWPIAEEMVEELLFEPVAEGRTRVSWLVYYTPTAWARPLRSVIEPVFRVWFAAALARLGERLAGEPATLAGEPVKVGAAAAG